MKRFFLYLILYDASFETDHFSSECLSISETDSFQIHIKFYSMEFIISYINIIGLFHRKHEFFYMYMYVL